MAKLLIVDDDPVIRTLLSDYLSVQGHEVDLADTARLGIERLEGQAYDVLLLDFQMPEANGIEVLQQINAKVLNAHLKIVMFSGNNDTKKLVEAAGLSADVYLTKPFELHDLSEEINKLI
ncbi:MAG: response regulator [Bdellovibrionales bacterium]|nr:response regulator [Bdellovibrionales bacterium]